MLPQSQSQSLHKRQQFHNKIRQRQHQEIFKKIRANHTQSQSQTNNQSSSQVSQEYSGLLARLQKMYAKSAGIESVVENMQQIVGYIGSIRKYQDEQALFWHPVSYDIQLPVPISDPPAFHPFLLYFHHLSQTIHTHLSSTLLLPQSISLQQHHEQSLTPYLDILLPISYCLINITSQQLSYGYLQLVSMFVEYRVYIDVFYNLMLAQNLGQLRNKLLNRFVTHLQQNPILYSNNCQVFTRIIYSSLCHTHPQKPLPSHILHLLDKNSSILSFLKSPQLYQYSTIAYNILQKLSYKNKQICWQIINKDNIIKSIIKGLEKLRLILISQGKIEDGVGDVMGLCRVVVNLGYFDQVGECLCEGYPVVMIHLCKIYERLSIQKYYQEHPKSTKLPQIYNHPSYPKLLQRLLNSISNLICVPTICQLFIDLNSDPKTPSISMPIQFNPPKPKCLHWLNILLQLYQCYYKHQQIRLQLLCIYSNCLIVIAKNHKNDTTTSILPTVLQNSQSLLHQILKLSNLHKGIIVAVVRVLRNLLEEEQMEEDGDREGWAIGKSYIFNDHSFMNRLHVISDGEGTGTDYYSQDVRMEVHYLIQAISIRN